MAHSAQLPLDLPHRVSLERDNFLVTQANAQAVAWLDQWPSWPAPVLVIYGPAASGKTHLTCVWAQKSSAVCVDWQKLRETDLDTLFENSKALILDDAHLYLSNRDYETQLFHLYNLAKEKNASLLMTMEEAPSHISFALPDLESRLRAAPSVAISAPSDEELIAVLVKMFSDRQIMLSQDVIDYILPRIERSYDAARKLVERADLLSLVEKKKITIPLIRRVIEADIID